MQIELLRGECTKACKHINFLKILNFDPIQFFLQLNNVCIITKFLKNKESARFQVKTGKH